MTLRIATIGISLENATHGIKMLNSECHYAGSHLCCHNLVLYDGCRYAECCVALAGVFLMKPLGLNLLALLCNLDHFNIANNLCEKIYLSKRLSKYIPKKFYV